MAMSLAAIGDHQWVEGSAAPAARPQKQRREVNEWSDRR
jgi:hypothetical protein